MMRGQRSTADRILVVVGTRPEAIKLAPVILALRDLGFGPRVGLTGQHGALALDALAQFGIDADVSLSLMRKDQPLAVFNERAVVALSALFSREEPHWVVVQGDTSSALCAAIVARQAGIAVAHVEAGLRSFDRTAPFPEEINRTLIARLADVHFAPTAGARDNLLAEGIADSAIEVTGNSVVDALRWVERKAIVPAPAPAGKRLIVATHHRRENRGAPARNVATALTMLAARGDTHVVLPAHPGGDASVFGPLAAEPGARLVEPMAHADFVGLIARAHLVITDSGGVQEEASALGVPTLVTRQNTERPEIVEAGTAIVVGTETADIVAAATRLLDDAAAHRRMARASTRIGDGYAARRIAGRLLSELRRTGRGRAA